MKKVANRRGSNIRLYNYGTETMAMYIPFARITAPDVSSDRVWARGGQADANMVPFDEPMTGTFTITTQIIPIEIIALAATGSGVSTSADFAKREVVTAETSGADVVATLTAAPVAGSLYCYKAPADAPDTAIDATKITLAGTTITFAAGSGVSADDQVICYYLKTESTAKHVTFENTATPGAYVIYSDTTYKDAEGTVVAEQMKCFKAIPQKKISISYQGSGDPVSMDLVFDLLEDDEGRVLDVARL